jgi:hypothetical protein
MPKPLINNKLNGKLSVSIDDSKNKLVNKESFKKYIRQNRSKMFVDAIRKLDAGSTLDNKQAIDNLVSILQQDFPFIYSYPPAGLLGIVACCYLGEDFEVHTIDFSGNIITHFRRGQSLPGKLEKARGLAQAGNYAFIEVYEDCLCAVSENGHVSMINI